jgi:hypothetical protein
MNYKSFFYSTKIKILNDLIVYAKQVWTMCLFIVSTLVVLNVLLKHGRFLTIQMWLVWLAMFLESIEKSIGSTIFEPLVYSWVAWEFD